MGCFGTCFAQTNSALQQKFDQQIAEISGLAKSGHLQEAIKKAEIAKTFAFENFKDSNYNQINILNKLNYYYKFLNDYENELATNIELFKIRHEDLKKEEAVFADSFKNLASYYASLDNPSEVISTFTAANERLIKQTEEAFRFRFEDERARFLHTNIQPYLDLFQSFGYKTKYKYQVFNNLLTNNILITKGALLNSSKDILKNLETLNEKEINKKITEYREVKNFITYQLTLNEAHRSKELISMQARLTGLESELVLYHRTKFPEEFTLEKNWRRTQLKENEIAIEFTHFNYFNGKFTDSMLYVAHVFKKNWRAPKLIPLFEESQIQHILSNTSPSTIYNSRGSNSTSLDTKSVSELYELIIKPLEEYLEGNSTIYISPDGILHQIAFAALADTDGKLLIEDYNLVQVNSTSIIQRTPVALSSNKACFIGGIDYNYNTSEKQKLSDTTLLKKQTVPIKRGTRGNGEDWPYLLGTKTEIENLESLFNQKNKTSYSLSGSDASENKIKEMSGQSPNILHIATHGFFFENPNTDRKDSKKDHQYKVSDNALLRSGLLFSGANYAWRNGSNPYEQEDGILTALEISNLNLSNTDLVVLSACETGLGEIKGNEGVYGLQRAFKMAGVDMIIMSLWEVPDAETAEFMIHFYSQWLSGIEVKQAFIDTQRKMHNAYPNHPEKWAAFVLYQ